MRPSRQRLRRISRPRVGLLLLLVVVVLALCLVAGLAAATTTTTTTPPASTEQESTHAQSVAHAAEAERAQQQHHQLKEEQRRQRQLQQEHEAREAEEALASVQDIIAKLAQGSGIGGRRGLPFTLSPPEATGDKNKRSRDDTITSDQAEPARKPASPASLLEQSAYYYHALEALYEQGNITLFAERLKEGAETTGHGRTHYLLGVLYANGVAVPHSESTAVLHFTLAALQGVPEAHLALAHRLEAAGTSASDGPQGKCDAAMPHYREAADAVAMTQDGNFGVHPYGFEPTSQSVGHGGRAGWADSGAQDTEETLFSEGNTPRANAERLRRRRQLDRMNLIVTSDQGAPQSSLLLGIQHLTSDEAHARSWQLAERYFLKALRQCPSFVELYLQESEKRLAKQRVSSDAAILLLQSELVSYAVGENNAVEVAMTHGLNPPLTAADKKSAAAATTATTPNANTNKKSGAEEPPVETRPSPDSPAVLRGINVAAQAYGFLGQMYATGDLMADPPVPRDFAKALTYFRRGALLSDCTSLNGLGFLHAVGYLREGRTQEEMTIHRAAQAASTDNFISPSKPWTGDSDFKTAAHHFRLGATYGTCAMSTYNLGVLYLHGLDDASVQNPPQMPASQAVPWVRAILTAGHVKQDGSSFAPSRDTVHKAEKLFKTAASQGSVLALWQLARLAERAGDCRAALALYRRVASYGSWMHRDEDAVPWSFALMEDWRDVVMQEKQTHEASVAGTETAVDESSRAPRKAHYGVSIQRRVQAQQEQRARLLAYQQTAHAGSEGQKKGGLLNTLRQHAAGLGRRAIGASDDDHHHHNHNHNHQATDRSGEDGQKAQASLAQRLLLRLMRGIFRWDSRTDAHLFEDTRNGRDDDDILVTEPTATESAQASDSLAAVEVVMRPASTPIVALVEGLALAETGFVDYHTAWHVVEVLDEAIQVPEEVYESISDVTGTRHRIGSEPNGEKAKAHHTVDDDNEAGTSVLVRDGWLDPTDARFSAHDAVPAGASALLDEATVLLQWKAPYRPLSGPPRGSLQMPEQRLVSQKEARKLLLHDLLQRFVQAAANRMPSEDSYMPSETATVSGFQPLTSNRAKLHQLMRAFARPSARLGLTLPSALYRLAEFYYHGESGLLGVDMSLALHYYSAAAVLGHSQAAFNAGMMLQLGLGNHAEADLGGADGDADAGSTEPVVMLSLEEAAELVARHPLTRILSMLRALPIVGHRFFGWTLRFQEGMAHVLSLPPEVALVQLADRQRLHGTTEPADWLETNDYLAIHALHVLYRTPIATRRCDLALAKRYYDMTASLNPHAWWATRAMLWGVRWQSEWLGTPYDAAPPAPSPPTPKPSRPSKPRQQPASPPPRPPQQPAGTARPTTATATNKPSFLKAALQWMVAHTPGYRRIEDVVLYAAVGVMGTALYLIFA